MKNNFMPFVFALLGLLVVSCQDEIGDIGDLNAPMNLQVNAEVMEDGSGIVDFDASADDALVYHYYFGVSENESATVSKDGKIRNIYRSSGDYTVKVIAYGPGGIASNSILDVSVDVVYEPPSDLIALLTGEGSRNWIWKKDVIGHLGVGPVLDDAGNPVGEPIWYMAQPFEKEADGCLYEDTLTFSLVNNLVEYRYNNSGNTFFNRGEVNAALGVPAPGEDQCYAFESPVPGTVGFFEAEGGPVNSTGVSFLLGNNNFMSYYVGSSAYEILSYSADELYVRVIQTDDAGGEFAWYQRFVPTNVEDTTPEIEYELVWEDDFVFNGAPSSSRWSYDLGTGNNGWGNGEAQFYTDRPDNVFIENGILNIIAKRENFSGSQYTSTRMKTQDKFEFTYGKVEIRAKLPLGGGTWPALWMLGADFPDVGWPTCGEIDIMEHVGNDQDVIHGTLHTPSSFGSSENTGSITVNGVSEDFHIYEMEWTPDFISFSVDGNKFYTYNPEAKDANTWPFDKDQFLIMNVAIGGTFGGAIASSFTESRMQVDYVKVYQEI